ncbi:MAG: glycosyltransferase [Planctomycetota bacterium]|jgi:glycosyltransferase involved in cell wall biosynthesis
MRPLVSIVIPCFNAERTIAEAIQSGLDQTYEHREIIVIDDGSTDRSLEIIQSFGNQIRWETGPNRGGNHARNRGIQISQGEFIQFLDADDLLYPNKLEVMVPVASARGNEYLVASGWDLQKESSSSPAPHPLRYDGSDPFAWCLKSTLQTSAPIHRKNSLLAVKGFDETLRCCQEYDLHLRLFANGLQLSIIDESLFVHRRQINSISADIVKILIGKRAVLSKLARSEEIVHATTDRRQQIANTIAHDARHLIRWSQWREGKISFQVARSIEPGSVHRVFERRAFRVIANLASPEVSEWLLVQAKRLSRWAIPGNSG